MVDTGIWDDECREILDDALSEDDALIGLTLMFYGAYFTTDRSTVEKICNYERYIDRLRKLDTSEISLHETAKLSIRKAIAGGW
jgi:hypothetical protein